MRRTRLTITLSTFALNRVDRLIQGSSIRNRSQAIENIINSYMQPKIKTAVILAGGKGTKLRPYTYEVPTPLLPIHRKPLLSHLLEQLKHNGIERVILCTGYHSDQIESYFRDGAQYGLHIQYSKEQKPLLTGGALKNAQKLIGTQPFLLIHGDIATTLSFQDLIDFHEHEGTIATAALTTTNDPSEYGQLKLHGARLVDFFQNTRKAGSQSNLINCGIYVCEPNIFDFMPIDKKVFMFEDIITTLIKQKQVSGFVFEGQWHDVGTQINYERAIRSFKT